MIPDLLAQVDPAAASSWWGLAKELGPGATLILFLGIALSGGIVRELWSCLKDHQTYHRAQDKATATVLESVMRLLEAGEQKNEANLAATKSEILTAVRELRTIIEQHRK